MKKYIECEHCHAYTTERIEYFKCPDCGKYSKAVQIEPNECAKIGHVWKLRGENVVNRHPYDVTPPVYNQDSWECEICGLWKYVNHGDPKPDGNLTIDYSECTMWF